MTLEELRELVGQYGGKLKPLNARSFGLQSLPHLESGYCLAFAILSISRKDGTQLMGSSQNTLNKQFEALPSDRQLRESDLSAHCSKIMTQQRSISVDAASRDIDAIYQRSVAWMKTLAPAYELVYEHHKKVDGDRVSGLNSGTIAKTILKTAGRYIIGMSGRISHAMSVYSDGGSRMLVYEPNYGGMIIPRDRFTDFCMMFYYKMHKSGAYKYTKAIVVRFAL